MRYYSINYFNYRNYLTFYLPPYLSFVHYLYSYFIYLSICFLIYLFIYLPRISLSASLFASRILYSYFIYRFILK